jgi:tetratricopeptide (TPR) repeat protein
LGTSSVRANCAFQVCLVTLLSYLASNALADHVHGVRLGAFQSETQANLAKQQIPEIAPVTYVVPNPDSTTSPVALVAGKFVSKSEAWIYKRAVESDAPQSTQPISVIEVEAQGITTSTKIPVRKPFDLNDLSTQAMAQADDVQRHLSALELLTTQTAPSTIWAKSPAAMTKQELREAGLRGDKNTTAVLALERLLAEYPNDSDNKRFKLRLARRVMTKDKQRSLSLLQEVSDAGTSEEKAIAKLYTCYWHSQNSSDTLALEQFKQLANDREVPLAVRRDAMRSAAGIAHRLKDYPTAWLAFEQIELAGGDPAVVADARVELAGLAFELAGSGKGDYADVREFCDRVLDAPDSPKDKKATAAMMRMESYFMDGETSQALTEVNAVLSEYADVEREHASSLIWEGRILAKLERFSEAEGVFNQVMQLQISAKDKFANREPRADAARWLVLLAKRKGESATAQQYVNLLMQEFPDAPETAEARAILGETVAAPSNRR